MLVRSNRVSVPEGALLAAASDRQVQKQASCHPLRSVAADPLPSPLVCSCSPLQVTGDRSWLLLTLLRRAVDIVTFVLQDTPRRNSLFCCRCCVSSDCWCSVRPEKKLKLKLIYDRRSVGQPALISGSRVEHMTKFFFSVWRLRVSCCGAPSLTRGWVCNLLVQLLLGLARAATLGPKSRRYHDTILVSHLRFQVPVFISRRNRLASYTPGHWVPFCRLLRLRATVEVF
jgi:hypothetical protein